MSFDLIILKPTNLAAADLSEVENVAPLRTVQNVSQAFNQSFPGCIKGAFVLGEEFAVEMSLNGRPVESVHLSLRFGQLWDRDSEVQFYALLLKVCLLLRGVAFAVSDNTKMVP